MDKNKIGLNVTSAPIGTWKRTDRPNDQPTDRHTDMMGHREVTQIYIMTPFLIEDKLLLVEDYLFN